MRTLLLKYKNYLIFFILLILLIALKVINPSFVKSISFISFDLYQKVFPLEKKLLASDIYFVDYSKVMNESTAGKKAQDYLKNLLRQLTHIFQL